MTKLNFCDNCHHVIQEFGRRYVLSEDRLGRCVWSVAMVHQQQIDTLVTCSKACAVDIDRKDQSKC